MSAGSTYLGLYQASHANGLFIKPVRRVIEK
jgi:hypothetical protein